MDSAKENQKRKAFRNILYELAKSQELLGNAYYRSTVFKSLEALYYDSESEHQYRHFYSDIFSVLIDIKQNPKLGNIDILGQNISMLKKGYQVQNQDENGKDIDISQSINKLYDHISLDIARISYLEAEDRKLSGENQIEEVKTQINAIQSNIVEYQSNVTKKIGNQQKEYIAILGIFAAVVLAFTGGISFSVSVFGNIAQASVYRIVIVTLVIGLVLVNILFGLYYYVNKIVSDGERLKPLVISNFIILILMLLTILGWWKGVIEMRNNNLHVPVSTTSTVECTRSLKQ